MSGSELKSLVDKIGYIVALLVGLFVARTDQGGGAIDIPLPGQPALRCPCQQGQPGQVGEVAEPVDQPAE